MTSPDKKEVERLRHALIDATGYLLGAAWAYKRHAHRHKKLGRAEMDPLYSVRTDDLEHAALRAQQAIKTGDPRFD